MIEILINNIRWRLIELLSRPDYIHVNINYFYGKINVMANSQSKYIGEVRYLSK